MIAEWRKLWRTVSLSKKVNKLSKEAALFWTWAIPHFSNHGFLEYDPEDLKTRIIPRRDDMAVENVPGYVEEIIKVKLWQAFKGKDGRVVLLDPRWFEMQNPRKDRMGQPPYNIKEMLQISTLLPDTPGPSRILPESTPKNHSRTLPESPSTPGPQNQLAYTREDKIREEKSNDPEKQQPVDNFPGPENEGKAPLFESLFPGKADFVRAMCVSVIASDPGFNPYQWITINKDRNPDALVHSLKRLKDALQSKIGKSISSWPYIEAILKDEDKNYNSREFDNRASKDKAEFKTLVDNLKTLQEKTKASQK